MSYRIFDGNNANYMSSNADITDAVMGGSAEMSVHAIIYYPGSFGTDRCILSKWSGTADRSFLLDVSASQNSLNWNILGANLTGYGVTNHGKLSVGWNSVGGSFKQNSGIRAVVGSYVSAYTTTSTTTIQNSSRDFDIGHRDDISHPWNGYVQSVAVWGVELSASDWDRLASGADPSSIQSSSLKYLWRLGSSGVLASTSDANEGAAGTQPLVIEGTLNIGADLDTTFTDFIGYEIGYTTSASPGIIDAITTGATFTASGTTRTGSKALRVTHAGTNQQASMRFTVSGSQTYGVFVGYFQVDVMPTSEAVLFQYEYAAGATQYARWGINTSGYAYADFFDATAKDRVTATGFGVLTTGRWYRVEGRLNTSGTTHTIEWGIAEDTNYLTTQNTVLYVDGTAGTGITEFSHGSVATMSTSGFQVNLDDIAWSNRASDYPIGNVAIHPLFPDGVGTHNLGVNIFYSNSGGGDTALTGSETTSYQVIDDTPGAVGTDYVVAKGTPAGTEYAEWTLGSGPGSASGNPVAVKPMVAQFNTSAGTSSITSKVAYSGSESTVASGDPGVSATPPTTTRRHAKAVLNTDPTGAFWAETAVNAMRLRWGYTTDTSPNPALQLAMVEVLYTPPESLFEGWAVRSRGGSW